MKDYKNEKPNLLILTSSFPSKKGSINGGGGFIYDLAKEQKKHFKIYVLTPFHIKSKKKETWENIEINRFYFLPFHSLYKFFQNGILSGFRHNIFLTPFLITFLISQFFVALKLVNTKNINVIHFHWLFPQGISAIFIKFLKRNIKVVGTSHGSDINSLQFVTFIKKIILKNTDLYFTVSEDLSKKAKNIYKNISPIICPMGVYTPNKFKKSFNNDFSLLFVGRLTEVKGCLLLPNIITEIHKRGLMVKLTIIGDGELKTNIQKNIDDLTLQDFITLEGSLNNNRVIEAYKSHSLIIIPSIEEGASIVLKEALAYGKLIVASNLEVFKEQIQHGVNGFLVSKNTCEEFAEQIHNVITLSKDEKISIRENAFLSAKSYDWSETGKVYNSNIFKLLN